jgi:hypothetical protein
METLVMDDARRILHFSLSRLKKHEKHLHLPTDYRSVDGGALPLAARPHISLKARMLGGQAKTIGCFRGFTH